MDNSTVAPNRTVRSNYETDGLLRRLYRDLETSLIPFELAIASGDRRKAIALQEHIDFVGAAMLAMYENKNLQLRHPKA